jgi:hypothetical protein
VGLLPESKGSLERVYKLKPLNIKVIINSHAAFRPEDDGSFFEFVEVLTIIAYW